MNVQQISVFVENRAGGLAEITKLLAENGVDLRAMSIADTTDYGILRLIVDKPDTALTVLQDSGCLVSVTPVLAVMLPDVPGGLAKILGLLSENGVDLEYLYAFITRKTEHAYVVLRVKDNEATEKVLEAGGITVASAEDIYSA
ncbi:MAG: ACT domain-containing protein [Oscillospiraceae bacterium]|nr:ACT domain-containing protein [Oscillospiraceae bacterium]